MDPFGNDEIARLLRLKRYEQPPPAYFENFLHDRVGGSATNCFVNRCGVSAFERAHGFAVQYNVRLLGILRPQVSRQWWRAPQ